MDRLYKMLNCRPLRRKGLNSLRVRDRLSLNQKLTFACGHVLNDLAGSAWFSYLLVFLTKVSELSNPHAGYVMLSSQIFEALWNPAVGIFCDRTVSRYGRRKLWHLIGTFCVTLTLPMIFMRCISCENKSSGHKIWYYIGLGIIFCFGWGATQIGHLALIPEICRRKDEAIELSALRSAVTFICGIIIYIVTWILLGQSKEEYLTPKVWKQFMYLGFTIVGTGTICNLIFHFWTDEPPIEDDVTENKDINHYHSKHRSSNYRTKKLKNPKAAIKVSCWSTAKTLNSKTRTKICKEKKECKDEVLSLTQRNSYEEELQGLEVIESNIVVGKYNRTWSDWLKDPAFYKTNMLYTCSRLVVIVSQAYLPLYLIETLKFEKESIAYFPLVVLISGVVASPSVGPLNKRLGSQIAFIVGCLLTLVASIWFFVQSIEGKHAVYMAAILIGCGSSIMLATSLSLIAKLIGQNKRSGAFVYGTIGFTDKLSSGVVIAIIQVLNPRPNGDRSDCPLCDRFVRRTLSVTPGCAALLGLILVGLFFESMFSCKRGVATTEMATQTESMSGKEKEISRGIIPHVVINHENESVKDTTAHTERNAMAICSNSKAEPSKEFQASDHNPTLDDRLFVKRNFLSSSWCNLESQAAVRLASYETASRPNLTRSLAV